MNFGFNSNVRVADEVYHVQTEDRGPAHPFLDTVVYLAGRVVYKRSTNYEVFAKSAKPGTLTQKLHERLGQQHRDVIAALEDGKLTLGPQKKGQPEPAGPPAASLDLRLTNPKSWFAAGNVILEIELCETKSKKRVGNADVQAYLERGAESITCAAQHTDGKGLATLKFPIPQVAGSEAYIVIHATNGASHGELRFRLKPKPQAKVPTPA